jgi:hypothetical protein
MFSYPDRYLRERAEKRISFHTIKDVGLSIVKLEYNCSRTEKTYLCGIDIKK